MKITFWGAARQVSGSMTLLEFDDEYKVLIDCGTDLERENNPEKPKFEYGIFPFDPSLINLVILTHAHIDHSGQIPNLYREGFEGQVLCTKATMDLSELLLLDAASLNQRKFKLIHDSKKRSKKRKDVDSRELYLERQGEVTKEVLNTQTFRSQMLNNAKPRKLIFTYDSPAISTLAQHCNFQSINLYADAFLKTVGYTIAKDASFDESVKAEKFIWSQKGVDLQGFMIRDGSGLSPSGVLTVNNLVDILFTMRQDAAFNAFYASIPVVGVSGTVQNLAKGSKAAGNVRAKSGSIANTRAFSGYYTNASGELMSFAFIINRYADGADRKARKYLEDMIKLMIEL